MLTRRNFGALIGAAALAPGASIAQDSPEFLAQRALMFGDREEFITALGYMLQRNNLDMAAGIIQAMRFQRLPEEVLGGVLTTLTGETELTSWFDWTLWQERNPNVVPHESFTDIKRLALMTIDQNFEIFLRPEYLTRDKMKIRLEEIAWGGVQKDGIPSLDNPKMIDAGDADYLVDDDLVFGVSINGDARAYPLRIMGWHEMFNEVIGGVPLALAYCTLCGSGILFETARGESEEPFRFGSSGFLYRSNKLMFDRQTHSLWNQFTGEPVVGPLVDSGITLKQRPVVIDTWANWRAANPATTVLDLNTGFLRDYGSGVVYQHYFSSPDLMFPVDVDQTTHRQKDYVFGVRTFGGAKAWPLEVFKGGRVLNDHLLDTQLVLIGDEATRSVRAYERGDVSFTGSGSTLTDGSGVTWTMSESALISADGRTLPRVAGHIAYWFAWDGYMGEAAEIYSE